MTLQQELEIFFDTAGYINPEKVVHWAHDHPDSELHKRLEWDDAKAGHKFRVGQVRQLIAVVFRTRDGHRTTISPLVTRGNPDDGYRRLGDVLQDHSLTQVVLIEALYALKPFVRKYSYIRDLAGLSPERSKAWTTMFDEMIHVIEIEEQESKAA